MTSTGLSAIYNQHIQGGSGLKQNIKKRPVSTISNTIDALGATNYLNNKSHGFYKKAVKKGKKRGKGKKKMVKKY